MEAARELDKQSWRCIRRDAEHNPDGKNKMQLRFLSRSENVSLARLLAAGMAAENELTVAELDEIKVAVSEAVSNAIIHGYEGAPDCYVEMALALTDTQLVIEIRDQGVGIADIEEAMRPNFSGKSDRMGLGFAFMHSFMDEVEVQSAPGQGTIVTLYKNLP